MRIALVAHGFPPLERTGVENYSAGLARELARMGHTVEVFTTRRAPELSEHSLRREERDGYAIHWLTRNRVGATPREALDSTAVRAAFAEFLDRERPDVVHVQHVVKLSLGILDEVALRGLGLVYTLHDFFPICHRYTLLRPDLSPCPARRDAAACARCDLALAHLNRFPELGDYQMGVRKGDLDADGRAALARVLDAHPEDAGFDGSTVERVHEERRALDARRDQAFAQVDLFLSPSRFLADELARSGFQSERVRVLGYGIETRDLVGLSPVAPDDRRALRLGFFGGLSKHKGVHVLLDAFARSGLKAELSIAGGSSDRVYVEGLRTRAAALGVRWHGPYERADLPQLLAQVDVVVVPSIWFENQPLTIREAFAARRPVVASRIGALEESVRDEVDGWLFAPGDPAALHALLARLAADPALVRRAALAIAPVKGLAEHAAELCTMYDELVRAKLSLRAAGRSRPPASLVEFTRRVERIESLPTRELYERALAGLARLRAGLGPPLAGLAPEDLLRDAHDKSSRSQTMLRDARLENEWTHEMLAAAKRTTEAFVEERGWLQATQREHDRELGWVRETLRARDEEVSASKQELEWLKRSLAAKEGEIAWRRETIEAKERVIASLRAAHAETEQAWARLEEAFPERRSGMDAAGRRQSVGAEVRALVAQRGSLRDALVRLENVEASLAEAEDRLASAEGRVQETAQVGLAALEAQERLLVQELQPLIEDVVRTAGDETHAAALAGGDDELLHSVRATGIRVRRLLSELAWRREEMRRAQESVRRGFGRLFLWGSLFGQRVRGWGRTPRRNDHEDRDA